MTTLAIISALAWLGAVPTFAQHRAEMCDQDRRVAKTDGWLSSAERVGIAAFRNQMRKAHDAGVVPGKGMAGGPDPPILPGSTPMATVRSAVTHSCGPQGSGSR